MARCQSCNGLITKQDVVCYSCGDKLPKHEKFELPVPKASSPVGNLMFGLSLALPAVSLFSGYKVPLSLSLGVSGVFLLVKLLGKWRSQAAKPGPTGRANIPSSFRGREAAAIARRIAF